MSMRFVEVKGIIRLVTGLHIGAGDDEIHIGGIDNPIVKDGDGFPYIPGSSIKGKIRSLLEITENCCMGGKPSTIEKYPDSLIPVMFGDSTDKSTITRLLFRDSFLTEESRSKLISNNMMGTEEKHENSINRFKGTADNPRVNERAVAGLCFDFEIIVKIFDGDSEDEFKKKLIKGLRLLELDALGGSGSRGYGKVVFENVFWDSERVEI